MGTAHAMVIDSPVAEAYLVLIPMLLKACGPVADNEFFGIAVHKENTELLAKINWALAQLHADGTTMQSIIHGLACKNKFSLLQWCRLVPHTVLGREGERNIHGFSGT